MIAEPSEGDHGNGRSKTLLPNFDQMVVMGEENDLGFLGQLIQDFESRRSTLIIKVDEQVVGYKRKSRRPIKVFQD